MEGEKERRNLLVVSVAILLYFWLELPEGFILNRLLGADGALLQINSFRVWVAVLLLLLYQIYRYLTIGFHSGNKSFKDGSKELHARARAWMVIRINKEIELNQKKYSGWMRVFEWSDNTAATSRFGPDRYPRVENVDWDCLKVSSVAEDFGSTWWRGNALFDREHDNTIHIGCDRLDFSVRRQFRPLILVIASIRLVNTPYLAEFLIPVLLSVIALGATLFGVCRAW